MRVQVSACIFTLEGRVGRTRWGGLHRENERVHVPDGRSL
jgi:hypothetical protein